jgi:ArsR family transcriptional regulator
MLDNSTTVEQLKGSGGIEIMQAKQATKIFKALSCEQRLLLLQLLRKWRCVDTCCDGVAKAFTRASEELNISRSTLSHHFKELENAGLIVCVRSGQTMLCQVNEEALVKIQEFLSLPGQK